VTRYFLQRLLHFAVVVLGASVVVFVLTNVLVDPVTKLLPIGQAHTQAADQMRQQLGLNDPLIVQYLRFVWHALGGDFGESTWLNEPALQAAVDRLPATMLIAIPATVIGGLLGCVAGIVAARRPASILDHVVGVVSYGLISLAEFWVAIMLVLVFAVHLGWLPTSGYAVSLQSLVLPVAVLAIRPFAHTTQMMRSCMIAESGRPYSMTARSKGLSERRVVFVHLLRNAAIPVITVILYDLARIFAGTAVIVEAVYAWPGIGSLAIGALDRSDIYLVSAIALTAAVVVAFLNLLGDILNYWLDPRLRLSSLGARRSS
jgi:peptide/nickel transport system permease protein